MRIDFEKINELSPQEIKARKSFYTVLGIVFLVLGFFALIDPISSSMVVAFFVGVLLFIRGIFIIFSNFMFKLNSKIWQTIVAVLIGVVYCIIGYQFFTNPLFAVMAFAFLIGFLFVIMGINRFTRWLSARSFLGFGLYFFSSIIDIVLGILLLIHWPSNSIYLVSIFIGIQFVVTGLSLISMRKLLY